MNSCGKYREMISLMTDGELSEPQKTELAAHIGSCPDCKRLHDAFAFISSALDDGAEPPDCLLSGVMAEIRAATPEPAAKRHRPVWISVAALAACLTLILFTASRSGIFGAIPNTSAAGKMSATAELYAGSDVSDASGASESAPQEPIPDSETRFSAEYTAVTEAPAAEPTGTGAVAPEDNPGDQMMITSIAPEAGANFEDGKSAVSKNDVSMVRVFSGGVQELDSDPIVTFTDEESIRFFMKLLEFSEAGDGISVSGDPVFFINVTSDTGDYCLSVWIVDGRLCCMSDADDILYVAAGDAGDLFAFIAAA